LVCHPGRPGDDYLLVGDYEILVRFANLASRRRTGTNTVVMWIMQNYTLRHPRAGRSTRTLSEYDCRARTATTLSDTHYTGLNGSGSVRYSYAATNENRNTIRLEPRTAGDADMRVACSA
jgi:hypothetical protein